MKHTTEGYIPASVFEEALYGLVDDFAEQMKLRLSKKLEDGKAGWDDDEWPVEDIARQMVEQAEEGDPIDTANFAAFLWNRRQPAEASKG